jgi:hypothetical protein
MARRLACEGTARATVSRAIHPQTDRRVTGAAGRGHCRAIHGKAASDSMTVTASLSLSPEPSRW